jgi:hypothetical protein
MEGINMFRPHFQNPTATAIIEGLAIARYNQSESKWETTFLRNCGHYPRLTIREVNRKTGAVISTIRIYEIAKNDRISITVLDPAEINNWKFETPGDFDRITAHPQDLRWMLDIDLLHKKKVKRKKGGIGTNALSIFNGCFYTSVLTKEAYKKRWIDAQGTPSVFERIGSTGKTFGADFRGRIVSVEGGGSNPFNEQLTHRADSRFEIIFDNTCVGEHQPAQHETDFHNYYKLIDDSEGKADIQLADNSTAAANTETGEVLSGEIIEDSALSGDKDTPGSPIDQPPPTEDPLEDPDENPKIPACHSILEGLYILI